MRAHRKQPKINDFQQCGDSYLHYLGDRVRRSSFIRSRGQSLCGLKWTVQLWSQVQIWRSAWRVAAAPMQMDAASVKPASPYGSSLGMQAWKHHKGYSLPHIIPSKTVLQSIWIFHFSSQIHFQVVEYSFSFSCFPSPIKMIFHLAKLNGSYPI